LIEIHLYGKLRKISEIETIRENGVLFIEPDSAETMTTVLKRAGVVEDDAHSIFLNARLFAARSNMARWLGYQPAFRNPLDWNLDVPLNSGDRIGVFGSDMAALVV